MSELFQLVVLIFLFSEILLEISKLFFQVILLDLISDLVFFHSIQDVFVAFIAENSIDLFRFDIFYQALQFDDLNLLLILLGLDGPYFLCNEVGLIFKSTLLDLSMFYLCFNSTA